MSLLFNMPSRFVIDFLPRSKCCLISWLQVTICSDSVAHENKVCHYLHFSPSVCHEVMRTDAMIFVFWMLSFNPAFSLSSFILIKRLFSSSLYAAVRAVSYVYLRLLIFLQVILILAWDSSNLAFCII